MRRAIRWEVTEYPMRVDQHLLLRNWATGISRHNSIPILAYWGEEDGYEGGKQMNEASSSGAYHGGSSKGAT